MSAFDHDHNDEGPGVSRRRVLECMTWAGTGVLWTISGGVPRSLGLERIPLTFSHTPHAQRSLHILGY